MTSDQTTEEYGFCQEVYEIDGNANYMRCAKGCTKKLVNTTLGGYRDTLPECPQCESTLRPHIKLSDEDYDAFFNKIQSVQEKLTYCDCLILIGTNPQSSFCSTAISQAMSSGALIVEVGSSPVLEFGNVKQLVGFTDEVVPSLCNAIREKLSK